MELDLTDKVFIVTGGTDGLGAGLASRLVEEGARVAVCGRDPDRLTAVAARLGDAGLAVRADVTSADDVERLVARVLERWGRLDGLVNNAARSMGGPFEDFTDADWMADIDLKLIAAARLIRLCLPHLRRSPAAAIVNVLNVGAKAPTARSLPTSATRAAGLALTKALANELAPDRIRVNAILVGVIESGQWLRIAESRGVPVEELYAAAARDIPLGRVGKPHEFGDLASFLLSPRASFITGVAINLDGGSSPVW